MPKIGTYLVPVKYPIERMLEARWMRCLSCRFILVEFTVTKVRRKKEGSGEHAGLDVEESKESWFAVPRRITRPLDSSIEQEVPDLAHDFQEAAAILEDSPRLSALLSRRVEEELLGRYGGYKGTLDNRIKVFLADPQHPQSIKDLVDAPRKVGNWTAHVKLGPNDEILEASPEEASLLLDVVERLFDYFIVGPARTKEILAGIDDKQPTAKKPQP